MFDEPPTFSPISWTSISNMVTITSTAITHYGPFNDESRKVAALKFFEKYNAAVIACTFNDPYHKWFAPSAKFWANDGTYYDGGDEIWEWMKGALFGAYEKLEPTDLISTVILNGHEKGDRIIQQQTMTFWFKSDKEGEENLKGEGVPIRRTIEFVSGPSEVEGQGTDGLQYYVGKTFWDTELLTKERARRLAL